MHPSSPAPLSFSSPSTCHIPTCSIDPLCRLSHLVNPEGEACRCTTAPLKYHISPFHPRTKPQHGLLLGLYKHIQVLTPPPSPWKHKGGIYQYVLVTFTGQCCCRCIAEVQLCISRPPRLFGARQQGSSADHIVNPLSLTSPEGVETAPNVGFSYRAVLSLVQK